MDFVNYCFNTAWIIPLLPLIAFAIIILDRLLDRLCYYNLIQKNVTIASIVVGSTLIGLIHSIVLFLGSINNGLSIEQNFSWVKLGSFQLSFGYLVDHLSITMLLVVTSVSMLIQIYTHGYMKKDEGYRKFYAFLALFNFSMIGLVLSTNLFQIYIFWEMVGVCSYFLIGFWTDRNSAAKAAQKAFIVNRIGDCLFLIGILGLLYFTYSFWIQTETPFLTFSNLHTVAYLCQNNAGHLLFFAVGVCLFFGAVAKSAQFPLHTWLPDAMEGPTPISALIHAATMVAAGVFLVARLYPIFAASDNIMNIIAWTGAITLLMAGTIAITQTDIKRILAYSTCSQLGYMIFAMGIGAYSAGMFHLVTHAYFKAMLFLCSGAVIHGLSGEQDIRYMGGLRKYMPKTSITYLIGVLAISGIILSGFWSKDMILAKAFENIFHENEFHLNQFVLFVIAVTGALITAFYMFRSYFLTFEGEYKGSAHPHESPNVMTTPLIILAVPSTIIGFALCGFWGLPDFSSYVFYVKHIQHEVDIPLMLGSLIVALAGVAIAASFYYAKTKKFDPQTVSSKLKPLYNLSLNKWYFDEIYDASVVKSFHIISSIASNVDKIIVDGIVNLSAIITKFIGDGFKYIQNGKTQFSVLAMYAGLVIISILLIYFLGF